MTRFFGGSLGFPRGRDRGRGQGQPTRCVAGMWGLGAKRGIGGVAGRWGLGGGTRPVAGMRGFGLGLGGVPGTRGIGGVARTWGLSSVTGTRGLGMVPEHGISVVVELDASRGHGISVASRERGVSVASRERRVKVSVVSVASPGSPLVQLDASP